MNDTFDNIKLLVSHDNYIFIPLNFSFHEIDTQGFLHSFYRTYGNKSELPSGHHWPWMDKEIHWPNALSNNVNLHSEWLEANFF